MRSLVSVPYYETDFQRIQKIDSVHAKLGAIRGISAQRG